MTGEESWRSRLGFGSGVVAVILALGCATAYLASLNQADPPNRRDHLDCEGISADATSEGAYVEGGRSLYIAGFETTESPSQMADRFAAENRLSSLAERATGSPVVSQNEVYGSSHRTDIGFQTDDGRIIAVVTLVDDNGWKIYGSVRCAG